MLNTMWRQKLLFQYGIETNYGMYMGNFNVIEALATLAYSSRRKVFKKELLNSLLIYEKNFKGTDKVLIGSWAGAMGQGQFMPSSFLNYAIDYDKDKIVDIWNSIMISLHQLLII